MKIKLLFYCTFLCVSLLKAQSYLPDCNSNFYSLTTSTPQASSIGLINTTNTASLTFPALTEGLAIGPAFGFTAPALTFWSISNDTLWYYDGSNFIKSGHTAGNSNTYNIGGSANFIYGLDASTGNVYSYSGTGNANFLTTINSYTNGGLVEDIVGDLQDNFYILDLQIPQTLRLYNSTGTLVCTYPVSGIATSTNAAESFAIIGNTVNVQRGNEYYVGVISGSALSFTQTSHTLNPPLDFASCSVINTFISQISSNAGACLSSTLQLTAQSNMGSLTYTWSGPGIVGGLNGQTIQVNLPGVYSCSLQSNACILYSSVSFYTVYAVPNLSITASSIGICSGNSATLQVSGANSYTWQALVSNASSVMVNPITTTVYSVSGTNLNGCTSSTSIALSVTNTPVLNSTASPSIICYGASTTLSVSGATSYTWVSGSTVASSLVLSPATSSVFSVSGANGTCISSTTVAVTVNPNPILSISNSPGGLCTGNSQTLSASGAGSYSWSPVALSGSLINVSPTVTTIYTVTGTNPLTGCYSSTTTILSVTITPTLTIVSPPAICSGNSATFSVSGASTYSWSHGSITTSVITVSPVNTTSYTAFGYNGICATSKTLNLIVNALPTITLSSSSPTLCSNNTVSLNAAGAVSYTWSPGNLTGQTVTVSPVVSTIYSISGTSAQGCTNTANMSLTVFPTPNLTVVSSATAICPGGQFTITSSGATTYSWVNNGPIPPAQIFGVMAGTTGLFIIAGTTGPCTATASVSVVGYPQPPMSIAVNPTIICVGEVSTLTASGVSTYTWVSTGLTGSITSYTGLTSGTYAIVATGTGSNGCFSSASNLVTVRPSPVTFITYSAPGSNTICSGNSATLTGNGTISYTWQPGSVTGSNIVVSPTVTTVYTVTGSDNFGCKASFPGTVTVYQTPTIIPSASTFSVCQYSSLIVSASGASSYSWSPGNMTGPIVTIAPLNPTIYTITGVNGINCTSTKTVNAVINISPTITIAGGSGTICSGYSQTLTASGANTYTWIPINVLGQSVIVSPTVNAIYVAMGTNSFDCVASAVTTISVVNPPVINAVANPTLQCAGKIFTLSATGAGTYSWIPNNTSSATTTVSPAATTIYTVSGSNGFCSVTKTLNVQVNPSPFLSINNSSPVNVCSGDLVSILASGADSYTWFPGNTSSTTLNIAPQISTNYTLSGSNSFNCKSNLLVTVNVIDPPTLTVSASRTLVCVGEEISLTASGATSYTWNGMVPGAIITGIAANGPTTTYSLLGMDMYGCKSSAEYVIQIRECTALAEYQRNGYSSTVYPNPNSGVFKINVNSFSEKTFVEIYNDLGQLLLQKTISGSETLIDLQNRPAGIYLLLIKDENKVLSSKKLIRE